VKIIFFSLFSFFSVFKAVLSTTRGGMNKNRLALQTRHLAGFLLDGPEHKAHIFSSRMENYRKKSRCLTFRLA
jgi:hypothetical protein